MCANCLIIKNVLRNVNSLENAKWQHRRLTHRHYWLINQCSWTFMRLHSLEIMTSMFFFKVYMGPSSYQSPHWFCTWSGFGACICIYMFTTNLKNHIEVWKQWTWLTSFLLKDVSRNIFKQLTHSVFYSWRGSKTRQREFLKFKHTSMIKNVASK